MAIRAGHSSISSYIQTVFPFHKMLYAILSREPQILLDTYGQ